MGAQGAVHVVSGNEFATPQWVVDDAARVIARRFTLDAAATAENAKCQRFFTREQDSLSLDWSGVVWLNPPFSRSEKACLPGCQKKRCAKRGHLDKPSHGAVDFAAKCVKELQAGRVEFIAWHGPVATDTAWYKALWPWIHTRIDYSGRIGYNDLAQGGTFPSQTLILMPVERQSPWVETWLHVQPSRKEAKPRFGGDCKKCGLSDECCPHGPSSTEAEVKRD